MTQTINHITFYNGFYNLSACSKKLEINIKIADGANDKRVGRFYFSLLVPIKEIIAFFRNLQKQYLITLLTHIFKRKQNKTECFNRTKQKFSAMGIIIHIFNCNLQN
jgi:hypothetical protein